MEPLITSLSGTRRSRHTGQDMKASMPCPGRTASLVVKSKPVLLIFKLSLLIQFEPGWDPIRRYLTARRNGKRRLVRRSFSSLAGPKSLVSLAIREFSLRKTDPCNLWVWYWNPPNGLRTT
jgi:hypothetical protein